jgi:hypothetical protein
MLKNILFKHTNIAVTDIEKVHIDLYYSFLKITIGNELTKEFL